MPKWMARAIEKDRGGRFSITGQERGQEPDQQWGAKGKLGLLTNEPCQNCNNGWMSRLEERVKPVLLPMIDGGSITVRTDQQVSIARWTVKTAMNYEFFRRRNPRYFMTRERRAMAATQETPHQGILLFLARYRSAVTIADGFRNEEAAWTSDYDLPLNVMHEGRLHSFNAYVFTLAVGDLAIQMFCHRWTRGPLNFTIAGAWDDAASRIWPGVLRNVKWPPPAFMDRETFEAFVDRWKHMISPDATTPPRS